MWKALNTICYSIEAHRQLSNVTKFVSYTFKAVKYIYFFFEKTFISPIEESAQPQHNSAHS